MLKIDNDENPKLLFVYSLIHRVSLRSKGFLSVFNEVLKSIVKRSNAFEFHEKYEQFFKQFCNDTNG